MRSVEKDGEFMKSKLRLSVFMIINFRAAAMQHESNIIQDTCFCGFDSTDRMSSKGKAQTSMKLPSSSFIRTFNDGKNALADSVHVEEQISPPRWRVSFLDAWLAHLRR